MGYTYIANFDNLDVERGGELVKFPFYFILFFIFYFFKKKD
jgi:hypothetical protein